jgi:hypothetical protein
MKIKIIVLTIIIIAILEIIALLKNLDGQMFSIAIAGICTLLGYVIGKNRRDK